MTAANLHGSREFFSTAPARTSQRVVKRAGALVFEDKARGNVGYSARNTSTGGTLAARRAGT